MPDACRLGASLYVPAIHPRLADLLSGRHLPGVRSLIACTEDALDEADLPRALAHLAAVLPGLPPRGQGPLRFLRPRNAHVLGELLALPGIERLDGFVIPKADTASLPAYEARLAGGDAWLMPTLESAEVCDALGQRDLRRFFETSRLRPRILALRIGGNDLLGLLALKRARGATLYDTPVGLLIQQLVLSFRPHGFALTAPVYDFLDDPETLARETRLDVAMGLVAKSAVHPGQVAVIERELAVRPHDLRAARAILDPPAAVFRADGAMLEAAVHAPWARAILARDAARDPPRAGAVAGTGAEG